MGLTATETVHLRLACDGSTPDGRPCPVVATFEDESMSKAVLQARDQGWTFRYPLAACPVCRLPEKPLGRATVIKR